MSIIGTKHYSEIYKTITERPDNVISYQLETIIVIIAPIILARFMVFGLGFTNKNEANHMPSIGLKAKFDCI